MIIYCALIGYLVIFILSIIRYFYIKDEVVITNWHIFSITKKAAILEFIYKLFLAFPGIYNSIAFYFLVRSSYKIKLIKENTANKSYIKVEDIIAYADVENEEDDEEIENYNKNNSNDNNDNNNHTNSNSPHIIRNSKHDIVNTNENDIITKLSDNDVVFSIRDEENEYYSKNNKDMAMLYSKKDSIESLNNPNADSAKRYNTLNNNNRFSQSKEVDKMFTLKNSSTQRVKKKTTLRSTKEINDFLNE